MKESANIWEYKVTNFVYLWMSTEFAEFSDIFV